MSEINRRDFLKVLGLSGASTSILGCAQEPAHKLIPYLVQPEEIIPGVPTWYASTCRECPAGCGLHVKVREGRPTKVEGNPDHPVNAGRLCARGQASLQGLYNPDRIQRPLRRIPGTDEFEPIDWEEAETTIVRTIQNTRETGRDALYLMTDGARGSLDDFLDLWMTTVLGSTANRVVYESFGLAPLIEANRICFGTAAPPRFDIDRADLVLSFGAEFLETWISPVQYARTFARAHSFRDGAKARFVHLAPRLSLTGSNADEWVAARPGSAAALALAMAGVLADEGRAGARAAPIRPLLARFTPESAAEASGVEPDTIVRLAHELADAPASLVLPPGTTDAHRNATADHIAVNILNYVVGSVGRTLRFGPNVARRETAGPEQLGALVEQMNGGAVDVLLVHGVDPIHTLAPGLGFTEALGEVGLVVSFASYMDETAAHADLILPDHTPLESWGDHVPEAGVRSLIQPTIEPIFDTRPTPDVLLSVAGQLDDAAAERLPWDDYPGYLQARWREVQREYEPGRGFEAFWRDALARGGVWREVGTDAVTLDPGVADFDFAPPWFDGDGAFHLLAYPSPTLYDGRGANRPWLQELPDPVTKVVWNSWIEISPETARSLGAVTGDVLEVAGPEGTLEVPAYVYRGIRADTVAIPIGQGHRHLGRYARDRGVNPIELLPAAADVASGGTAWLATRVRLRRTGRRARLVESQGADTDHGREVAELMGVGAAAAAEAEARRAHRREPDALVEAAEDADPKSPYRWGMAIDLSSCIGCSACVTACYAENNVPIVGEERFAQGREMSWIRIERYFEPPPGPGDGHGNGGHGEGGHGAAAHAGDAADGSGAFHTVHLPMLCQHCGNAPCEPVCPVYATYHNPEGLNVQVYNRCVGTRYCSNNCPYKVRRFEWFEYEFPFPLNLQLNPDVTVRGKGVMEKCTFCVQRIQSARIDARAEGRTVADGEVVPACAQTCPAEAIVFGNLRDPQSRVSQLARSGREYHVLAELNTRPAITYLSEVTRGAEES